MRSTLWSIAVRLTTITIVGLAIVLAVGGPAGATWSLVGVDEETGEVGVAIASCVPADQLGDLTRPLLPVTLVPDVGAAVSQGQVNSEAPARIALLLESGKTPDEVIADVTSEEFDEQADARQNGIVTLDGMAAGFTGTSISPESSDRQTFAVAVQGNLLVSTAVVDDALAAFQEAGAAPLADRLVAGLVAGSLAGGDRRCAETAFFAQVAVAGPGDTADEPGVLLTYAARQRGDNPVLALAEDFAEGARREVVVPEAGAGGFAVGAIGIVLGTLLLTAGIVFWRRAYRR